MWEDGGLVDVAVAVDGVDAVDHGDLEARGERTPLHLVDHLHPRLRRRVGSRHAPSAAQHAPCRRWDALRFSTDAPASRVKLPSRSIRNAGILQKTTVRCNLHKHIFYRNGMICTLENSQKIHRCRIEYVHLQKLVQKYERVRTTCAATLGKSLKPAAPLF